MNAPANANANAAVPACPMCQPAAPGSVLWSDDRARVILADQSRDAFVFPGLCRVIWTAHVAEMTDLPASERAHLMDIVWDVEAALRAALNPDKINLASFGNFVPHLHWHLIPRWVDDSHFPESTWGKPPEAKPPTSLLNMQQRLALVSRIQPELLQRRAARAALASN